MLQYRTLDRNIDRLEKEKSKWRARAESVSPVYSDTPRAHGGSDKIQEAVERIIELEQEINQRIDELVTLRRQIEGLLASLKDEKLRELMQRYYIDGNTWEQVAEKMEYSDSRWPKRMHKKALAVLSLTIESHYL